MSVLLSWRNSRYCVELDHVGGAGGSSARCAGTPCDGHTLGAADWLIMMHHFNITTQPPWKMTATMDTYVDVPRSYNQSSCSRVLFSTTNSFPSANRR